MNDTRVVVILSSPQNSPALIVAPDRDTPGTNATRHEQVYLGERLAT